MYRFSFSMVQLQGYRAYIVGITSLNNPHRHWPLCKEFTAWQDGWLLAQSEVE